MTELRPDDPYAAPSSLWMRHGHRFAAAGVFIATIVLIVLAFPPSRTPEFAYAFAVPALLWAYRRPSFRLFALTVLGAQAVAWTFLLGWLHHVTWLGLFLLGPFVGVWVGSWFLAARWALPRILGRPTLVRLLVVLGLAGLWVVIEWSRTWLLSGFPWLPLAASQWQRTSILQIAAYTGAGGVSFVLIAMNLGFAAYAHRLFFEGRTGLNRRSQEFFATLFLLLVCLTIHVQETFNRGQFTRPYARFAIVQPDIPQAVKWDPASSGEILAVLEKSTLRVAKGNPDVILWPEATTPWAIKGDASVQTWTERLAAQAKVPIVLGSMAIEETPAQPERWYNGVFAVDPATGLQPAYYAKRKLVPFGEFVPFRSLLGWIDKFVPVGGDFSAGENLAPLTVPVAGGRSLAVGVQICYEDIFPRLARLSVLAGADVLTVHTNNGWFGRGGAAYQHAAHSVLRAVETRRPVVRVGNAGWSGWIDEFGHARKVLTDAEGSVYFWGEETIAVTVDARWVGRRSFFVQHGDWFVAVSTLLAFGGWALLSRRSREG